MDFPFTRDRYRHALLERAGDVCLVERTNLLTGSVHWEVVRLLQRPAESTPSGRQLPAREVYPHDERWGERGWTFTTLTDAMQKYRALAPAPAKEARDASGT